MISYASSIDLPARAVLLAHQSIGVREETPNWGKWVQVYLKFVGLLRPAPWCAAFVAYKIHQAADQLGIKARWPKSGYVQGVVNWARKNCLLYNAPVPHQAFVVWHPELKRYAHIGFIVSVGEDGRFLSVEGNSNTDGSREGKEVVSQWRKWDPVKHRCIRII